MPVCLELAPHSCAKKKKEAGYELLFNISLPVSAGCWHIAPSLHGRRRCCRPPLPQQTLSVSLSFCAITEPCITLSPGRQSFPVLLLMLPGCILIKPGQRPPPSLPLILLLPSNFFSFIYDVCAAALV